jgi:microcystin-dependent protein
MSYNSNLPEDITLSRADIRENLRALKEDKIVAASTAVVADSAAKLTTARKISLEGDATGSTSFDGSADVAIQVDVLSANVSATCTGNAATATKLETARNINGVAFDGTKDITITAVADGGNTDTVGGYKPNDLMPLGAVIMWSGSIATIPSKWALCNGANGTPDLRNKFVLGAGSSYAAGAIGGEPSHTLTVAEMPAHFHYVMEYAGCIGVPGTTAFNNHIASATNDASSNGTSIVGGSQAHNNMPPYYALAYIMRIA